MNGLAKERDVYSASGVDVSGSRPLATVARAKVRASLGHVPPVCVQVCVCGCVRDRRVGAGGQQATGPQGAHSWMKSAVQMFASSLPTMISRLLFVLELLRAGCTCLR